MITKPELMAPAGDWTMLRTAVNNGANAVYFGVDKLNMRAKAKNFLLDELNDIVSFCKEHKVKTYLTLNTILFEEELSVLDQIIPVVKNAGVDMVICWDFGIIEKCNQYEMPFAVSTQASISNSSSAKTFERLGAKRIVLARECSLEEIKKIRTNTDLEIEAFVHGAMCVAVSGRCFMSHEIFGQSANRGECVQPCRREYKIYDGTKDTSLLLGEDYVMSAKDLCTIEFLDELIEAGINSFKIEGRKRSPEYVAKVVSVYRRAIDLYFEKKLTDEVKQKFLTELTSVYNRGFSSGFYFDKPDGKDIINVHGSVATTRKEYVGKVLNYYKAPQIVHVAIETGSLKIGDTVLFIGETTGVIESTVAKILNEEVEVNEALKGDKVTFYCEALVRPRDKVYLVKNIA
ncbi:MAG: protease [Ignavibacteria bacterium CG22_combo_CG10-13_8_21_14_all_37_15]|nr:MAG: protease [Ignavibacteria bacterium CG22_combo_CG10-13_8_21_14_all_37_15]